MRWRLPILVLAVLLVLAPSASAQGTITEAAAALRETPVYVDPEAERALSSGEVVDLRRAIARTDAGPAYIAVLPGSAAEEAGGDPVAALHELALSVGEPGTYAAVIGDSFRAGATGGVLPEGRAGELAGEAFAAERAQVGGRGVDGVEPHMREVAVGGRSVPYWQAGPAFAPWAGGFFGAGLLPGLFVGSMLGGAFGGFGYPDAAYGGAEDPSGGDFGDFGGGDFCGGDFGGGGDF